MENNIELNLFPLGCRVEVRAVDVPGYGDLHANGTVIEPNTLHQSADGEPELWLVRLDGVKCYSLYLSADDLTRLD